MKHNTTCLALVCLVLMSAGLHAVSGRTLQSSSQRRLAQAAQLRFRQSGCDGIQFAVTARPSMRMDDTTAHGTVVIRNLNNVSIPLAQVTVQVLNVATVTPFYTYAKCLNATTGYDIDVVPAAMGPGLLNAGSVTCTYKVDLPEASLAPGSTDELSVQATATIDTLASNASAATNATDSTQCTSDTVNIDTTLWTSRPQDLSTTTDSTDTTFTNQQGWRHRRNSGGMQSSGTFFQSSTSDSDSDSDDDSDSDSSDGTFNSQQGWHRRNSGSGKGKGWFGGWGGRRLSQATPIQMPTNQLGYVPTGCQGLTVTTTANQQQPGVIGGTVVLTNPNTFDIPIASVDVFLANNVGLEPLHTTATCAAGAVPSNPQPYTVGELLCTFSSALPNSGPVAGVPIWTEAMATATIGMSNAKCSSPAAVVSSVWPLGRRH